MLPLWCDVILTRCSPDQNDYPVPDPTSADVFALDDPEGFRVDWHPAVQAPGMPGVFGMTALPKMVSPWLIETDEGWSVYVTPATHHSGTLPFEPIAGIIDLACQLHAIVINNGFLGAKFNEIAFGLTHPLMSVSIYKDVMRERPNDDDPVHNQQ